MRSKGTLNLAQGGRLLEANIKPWLFAQNFEFFLLRPAKKILYLKNCLFLNYPGTCLIQIPCFFSQDWVVLISYELCIFPTRNADSMVFNKRSLAIEQSVHKKKKNIRYWKSWEFLCMPPPLPWPDNQPAYSSRG